MIVYGKKKGVSGWLFYSEGKLTGEPMLVQHILTILEYKEGCAVGDINYHPLEGSHLESPISVRLIIEESLDEYTFFGKLPKIPKLPPNSWG